MSVNWNSLNLGDTISIEVLQSMTIYGQNTGRYTGVSFKASLNTGDKLTGQVTKIGGSLEISTGPSGDGEARYSFPIQEEKKLLVVLQEKYVPPPPKPPPTAEEIATEEQRSVQREADIKERAERFAAEQKLKLEQQQEKEKVRQEEIKKLGPWNVILNNGNSRLLNLGDTISIEVLQSMTIYGKNTGWYTGGSFQVSYNTGDKLTGQVTKIGEILEISTGSSGDGEALYSFPIQEKKNLVLQEKGVSPDVPQEVLSRAFGSPSKGGNKKSRKIYKKKTKNRTKTKKKKSRTSIKKHKLKKTSRRSRRSRKSKN